MVCAEIHARFGVPRSRLEWLKSDLINTEPGFLTRALSQVAELGLNVFLQTDLKGSCIIESDLEYADLFRHRVFGNADGDAFIFVFVNPILKKLCSLVPGLKVSFDESGFIYDGFYETASRTIVCSREELEFMDVLRNGNFNKVEVKLRDGEIVVVSGERDIDTSGLSAADVINLMEQHKYQTMQMTKADGSIVKLSQKISMKPGSKLAHVTEKS